MYKKYFQIPLRHLFRQRLFTGLNILGLAVSISICWLVFTIVRFEYSYDKQLPNKQNTYRLITGFIFDGKESYNGGVSVPIYQSLRKDMTGLSRVVPVFGLNSIVSVEPNINGQLKRFEEDQKNISATDAAYFVMVPYKWLAGNAQNTLSAPNEVVLTESRAKAYFPNVKPQELLNKTITYYGYNDTIIRTIVGVVADLKGRSDFSSKEFCSLEEKAYPLVVWTNTNGSDRLYLQLDANADPQKVHERIEHLVNEKTKEWKASSKQVKGFEFTRWFKMLPLSEMHFANYIEWEGHKADKKILWGLMGIAFFLLVLACINYINMSIAAIPKRTKEIGVRKILGSDNKKLIGQFLIETAIVTLLASVLSLLLGMGLFRLLKDIIPEGVLPFENVGFLLLFIVIILIVVTLLSGVYPGILIAKVKPIQLFRNDGRLSAKKYSFSLQKALIVFQFMIAVVFIISAIVVGKQLRYAVYSDMGFNKDAVITTSVPWKYTDDVLYKDKQFVLLHELRHLSGVQEVALGTVPLSNGYSSSPYKIAGMKNEENLRQLYKKTIDTAYLSLYHIPLIAGRNIRASDTTLEYIINESATKALGLAHPEDAIGKMLVDAGGVMKPIVGVVKDFHTQDFHKVMDPVVLMSNKENMYTFNIKLTPYSQHWQETIKRIEKAWYGIYPPETFEYKFYDETIAKLYSEENNLAKLINLTTVIAIFISCIGLFGLAVLTTYQRTKEIGVRKVLGASVSGIVTLLAKDYLKPIFIAILLASPFAWWLMHRWLQNFAFKTTISWWLFVMAGFFALMIALLTVGFHAFRAAKANPVKSLRTE